MPQETRTAAPHSNAPGQARSQDELLRRNVEVIDRLEQAAQDRRSVMDRIIDGITAFCGSVPFVWIHIFWYGGWIAYNTLPGPRHFDPFPFQFLTLVVSLEAIMLSTFILITQNRQAAIADRRNELDLQINLLAEQENTKALVLLDAIARKLGLHEGDDPEVKALEETARPETIVDLVDRCNGSAR